MKSIAHLLFLIGLLISLSGQSMTINSSTSPDAPSEVQTLEGSFKDTIIIGALDKVTGRTTEVTFKVGELIKIGTLGVKALRAWTSNPEETPEAKVFFEIVEVQHPPKTHVERDERQIPSTPHTIFRGWMLASSPSASSLEHPVYNIWVIGVEGNSLDTLTPTTPQEKPLELDPKTSRTIDELIDHLTDSGDLPSDSKDVPVPEKPIEEAADPS